MELSFLCLEFDDELKEIHGPKCWHVTEADPGGVKEAMWLEIMMESDGKPLSTWLGCDNRREEVFYARSLGKKRTNIAAGLLSANEKLPRDALNQR